MHSVNLNSVAEVVAGALGVSIDDLRRPGSKRSEDPVRIGRRVIAIASEGIADPIDVASWLRVKSTTAVLNLRKRASDDDSPRFRTALGAAQRVLLGTKPEPQVTA